MKLITCLKSGSRSRRVYGTADLQLFSGIIKRVHDFSRDDATIEIESVELFEKHGGFTSLGRIFKLRQLFDLKSEAITALLEEIEDNDNLLSYTERLKELRVDALEEEEREEREALAQSMTCKEFVAHVYDNADYREDWIIAYPIGLSFDDVFNDDLSEYDWVYDIHRKPEKTFIFEQGNEDYIYITDYEESALMTFDVYDMSVAEAYLEKTNRDRHINIDAERESTVTVYTFIDDSQLQEENGEYTVIEDDR